MEEILDRLVWHKVSSSQSTTKQAFSVGGIYHVTVRLSLETDRHFRHIAEISFAVTYQQLIFVHQNIQSALQLVIVLAKIQSSDSSHENYLYA
jgi:hypothetical protein